MQIRPPGHTAYGTQKTHYTRPGADKKAEETDALRVITGLPTEPEENMDVAPAVWESTEDEDINALGAAIKESGNFKLSTSPPDDNSGELTRRLVGASGQFEIRNILSEASSSLIQLRMVAAMSTDKDDVATAKSAIKKMEKLIRRCNKKIKDLDKEDGLKIKEVRARQERKLERVREIKAELRREQLKRRSREQGYLLEQIYNKMNGKGNINRPNTTSEAAITAQAEAQAAAEMALETGTGGTDMGGDIAAAPAGMEGAATEGGVAFDLEVPAGDTAG